ncbi:MAG TPA: hypothetical protein VGZ71_08800 [Puia sp.]|jgi:hypothetical protein|nr:hypothetical protein [Puia sp.]
MKKLIALHLAIVFADALRAQSNELFVGADLIVFNAKITTENLSQPQASVLAVKRGKIYAVGTEKETSRIHGNGKGEKK